MLRDQPLRRYTLGDWSVPAWALIVLGLAVVAELAQFFVELRPLMTVDFIRIPLAAPAALVAFIAIVWPVARVGYRINRAYAIALAIVLALFLGVSISFITANGFASMLALTLDVLTQEVVFRFGIPLFIAHLLKWRGAHWRDALLIGLGISTALFLVAPGDFSELRAGGVFIGMSVLLAHSVWRGKSLVAAIAAHAIYTFLTVNVDHVVLSTSARLSFIGATLGLLATLGLEGKIRVVDLTDAKDQQETSEQVFLKEIPSRPKVHA